MLVTCFLCKSALVSRWHLLERNSLGIMAGPPASFLVVFIAHGSIWGLKLSNQTPYVQHCHVHLLAFLTPKHYFFGEPCCSEPFLSVEPQLLP